jgi:hypothetical protein
MLCFLSLSIKDIITFDGLDIPKKNMGAIYFPWFSSQVPEKVRGLQREFFCLPA